MTSNTYRTIDEPSHESNGTVTIIEFPEVALSYNSSLEVGSKTLVNGVLIIGHSCTLTTKSLETNESIIMKTNSLTKGHESNYRQYRQYRLIN